MSPWEYRLRHRLKLHAWQMQRHLWGQLGRGLMIAYPLHYLIVAARTVDNLVRRRPVG